MNRAVAAATLLIGWLVGCSDDDGASSSENSGDTSGASQSTGSASAGGGSSSATASGGAGAGAGPAGSGGAGSGGGAAAGVGGAGGSGTCTSSAECDDGDPCSDDSCDPALGCQHSPGACTGGPTWSTSFGDDGFQTALSVATDPQGNYVLTAAGGSPSFHLGNGVPLSQGAFVAKFDANHELVWVKGLGTSVPNDVAFAPSGHIVVAGNFVSTVDFGGGPLTAVATSDAFVLRLDPAGNHLHSARYGIDSVEPDAVSLHGVAVGPNDEVVVSGFFFSSVDFGGGALVAPGGAAGFIAKFESDGSHVFSAAYPERIYQSVEIDGAGQALAAGNDYITRLDASGDVLWDKLFADGDANGIRAAYDPSGDIRVMCSAGPIDSVDFGGGPVPVPAGVASFLIKLDGDGNHVWSREAGSPTPQTYAYGLAVDAFGNTLVTGPTQGGAPDFGGAPIPKPTVNQAVFLAKYGPEGDHLWSRVMFGSGAYDESWGTNLAVRQGNPLLIGNFQYSIDMGTGPLICAGSGLDSHDIFVAEYAP